MVAAKEQVGDKDVVGDAEIDFTLGKGGERAGANFGLVDGR